MPLYCAGFDRVSASVPLAGNELITGSLANCIGVAAHNELKMCVAHYNTINCVRPIDNRVTVDFFALNKFKMWLRDRLGGAGAANFAIGLGFCWRANILVNPTLRPEFLLVVSQASRFRSRRSCKPGGARASPRLVVSRPAKLPTLSQDWTHMGNEIPYGVLT